MAVEPVGPVVIDPKGNGAEQPGEGVDPIDHLDALGQRNGDGEERHPDHAPEDQHDCHGDHGLSGAAQQGGNGVGVGQQEEEERRGAGLLDAEADDLRVGVKSGDELRRKDKDQHADDLGQDDRGPNAKTRPLFGALQLSGSQVLAGESGECHGEAGDGEKSEPFDLGIGPAAGHGDLSKHIDVGLDHHVGKGDDGVLQAGGEPQPDDLPQHFAVKADFGQIQAIAVLGTHQLDEAENGADQLRDDRGDGRPLHPHVEEPDEYQVQHNVDERGDDQIIERMAAVSHRLEDTDRNVVEDKTEGAGKVKPQVEHRVPHDILGRSHP